MTDYTITTNFGAKDSLPSGNAGKVIKGSEFTTEFTNIATAVNTKANTAGDTFTGVVNFSDDIAVNTNTLFVDASTGKVGIGTTSPASKLHIDSGATDEVLRLEGTGSPYLSFYDTGVRQSYIGSTGNTLEIHGDTPDTNIALYTANTERMRIDSSGNIGIGYNSPDSKLDVAGVIKGGDVTATGGGTALGVKYTTGHTLNNFGAMFSSADTLIGFGVESHKSQANKFISTASNSNFTRGALTLDNELKFFSADAQTTAVGSEVTMTERMRIDSSGNVGIGTTSPTTTLDVAGTGTFTTLYVNSTNNSNLYLQNSNVGTSNLNFAEGDGTAQPIVNGKIEYNHSNETLDIKNKNNLALRVKDNGEIEFGESIGLNLATSGQTISDGHLYIHIDNAQKAALKVNNGQSSPSQFKLFESNKNEIMVKDNGEIAFQTEGEGGFRFDDNAFQPAGSTHGSYVSDMFTDNNNTTANLGTTTNRWNRIYLNNQPNVSSDQRLKENISDADDAGNTIDAIQVRKFDWIKDGTHQSYGMIAQELAEVYPEAVSVPENDEDTLGIAYADLIPMLIKEVQSLRSRVAELESE